MNSLVWAGTSGAPRCWRRSRGTWPQGREAGRTYAPDEGSPCRLDRGHHFLRPPTLNRVANCHGLFGWPARCSPARVHHDPVADSVKMFPFGAMRRTSHYRLVTGACVWDSGSYVPATPLWWHGPCMACAEGAASWLQVLVSDADASADATDARCVGRLRRPTPTSPGMEFHE